MFSTLEKFGDSVAVISEAGKSLSYAELAVKSDAAVTVLGSHRQIIAIECENTTDVLLAYIGALRAGHVVILTGTDGANHSSPLFKQFQPNYVFRRNKDGNFHFAHESSDIADLHPDLAVLLSTSGTTGSAKLVRLSHANIAANAESIGTYLQLSPTDRAITCLPMQYSYGLSVINSHLASGASLILTGKSISDTSFWDLFDAHKATNFQGVPHSFQLLFHSDFRDQAHPSLRFFTQAGGKLPENLVTAFGQYAQKCGADFFVMYGQTEATARMAWLPPKDTLKHPGVIGQAIPGGEFSIENDGQVVPEGETGELVYRGPNVMMGYALTRDDFAIGKITHELKTGDIAVRTASGYFKITGRANRFLKIFGLRIGLDDVEDRIRQLGFTSAATGTDERLIIAVENANAKPKIEAFVKEALCLPNIACLVIVASPLPRTYNGKTDYNAIKALAEPTIPVNAAPSLIDEARKLFHHNAVNGSKSFVELGGDSLSYVHFAISVENRLGHLPANWERIPLDKLENMAKAKSGKTMLSHVPMDIVLRTVAVVMVIINHVSFNSIDGASMLLLALAGYNFGRFQAPKIAGGHGLSVLKSLLLMAVLPYYITLIPVMYLVGPENLPNIMLMYNFIPDHTRMELPGTIIYFWYIEAYIIIVASLTVALSLPVLRHILKTHAWAVPMCLFVILEVLRHFFGHLEDSGAFNETSPVIVGSRFAAGWLLFAIASQKWRIVAAAVLIPYMVINPLTEMENAWFILAAGLALLVTVQSVPMYGLAARYIAPTISLIAASSLYIYMEQFYIINLANKITSPLSIPEQLLTIVISVVFGIAIQSALNKITSYWAAREATA